MQQSEELKKSLTNLQYLQVLQIIGLSSRPLSAYEIHRQWVKNHSQDRISDNKYIYEIIKGLTKIEYLGNPHPQRFLKISFKESSENQIRIIKLSEKDRSDSAVKIAAITNNPRNWRYRLNFRGFLLYLIAAHMNKKISNKIVNNIVSNLSETINDDDEFDFLQYFEIFEREKVEPLIKIAVELQYHLISHTVEYLKNYFVIRCYEEISILLAVKDNELLKKLSVFRNKNKKIQFENNESDLVSKIKDYQLRVLNKSISIQHARLKQMKEEKSNLLNNIDKHV